MWYCRIILVVRGAAGWIDEQLGDSSRMLLPRSAKRFFHIVAIGEIENTRSGMFNWN
jgi:hypothetical protein